MFDKFKLWSETNPEAKIELSPDLGLINWEGLDRKDKIRVWHYFIKTYKFKASSLYYSVMLLNEKYKKNSFGKLVLEHGGPHQERYTNELNKCCVEIGYSEFMDLFVTQSQNVVYDERCL